MSTAEDVARLDAIADYRILEQPDDHELGGLVRLAASICAVPTAVINVVDDRFQHQIAAFGFAAGICARDESMCAVVLDEGSGELVAVADARIDDRFAANPWVTGELGLVRFYASNPLRTPDGILIGTLCVFDEAIGDLTGGQREALGLLARQIVDVLELRRLGRELGRSNEQLARFAGQVSHDLRNPLATLSGFLELAADSPALDEDTIDALTRARSAAGRMNALIADLLEYARIGGAKPRREELRLDTIVGTVLEDLGAEIAASGATVVVDADVRVPGDGTLLRALMQNLVSNAVKFSRSRIDRPRVEIAASALDGGVRITVDDNGPGVPVADRERVFGLMERAGAGSTPGLGIGLSTCRRIVQAHGGRIGIDDSPLGGARTWVVLPSDRADRP